MYKREKNKRIEVGMNCICFAGTVIQSLQLQNYLYRFDILSENSVFIMHWHQRPYWLVVYSSIDCFLIKLTKSFFSIHKYCNMSVVNSEIVKLFDDTRNIVGRRKKLKLVAKILQRFQIWQLIFCTDEPTVLSLDIQSLFQDNQSYFKISKFNI